VADSTRALGHLATAARHRLASTAVVGLTGSQGKTSTKDLLAQLLGGLGPVVAPPGSLNNELGVPLTVLAADESTAALVVEMGARGRGHIAYLCAIAAPTVGLVLNVGTAHVGEFGSQELIAQAKGELVEALPANGIAVLNADDPLVSAMAARTAARVVTFGESPDADVRVDGLRLDDTGCPAFILTASPAVQGAGARQDGAPVTMRMLGAHQAANGAAAAAVALALGVPLDEVARRLSAAAPVSAWRMERHVRADGVVVINDAYNASPDAMRAALQTLAVLGRAPGAGRTVAVLGEMRELGASALAEHDAIGRLAVRLDISQLVVVGEAARALHLGALLEGSWDRESVLVPDVDAAVEFLADGLQPGDVVLIKASRAARLERVAEALLGSDVAESGTR
jgi:UDP-N-acetylmuramoyl-tripeptide--D-alanyl-D-alanine ligase